MEKKTCKVCEESKPEKAFMVSRVCKGKVYYRKTCRRCYQIQQREYQKVYKKEHYLQIKEKQTIYSNARRHKKVIMKDVCENCGNTGKLNMHHPDYSKPLEVITLCIKCHEKQHHRRVYI